MQVSFIRFVFILRKKLIVSVVALSRYRDVEVSIFEAATKLAEVGAGVGVFPRTPSPSTTHRSQMTNCCHG